MIKCPKCGHQHRSFSFAWPDLGCPSCNAMINKYEWLVQVNDSRTKTSEPSLQESLAIGRTIYVNSTVDDTWLSFYYMCDEGEVQVIKGSGNVAIGRDFVLLDRAFKDLAVYEGDKERWNIEVKG
jgi:hypothetical protein